MFKNIGKIHSLVGGLLMAFFMLSSQASAQDISLHLDEIPPGLVTVYERSDGSVFSKLYVGPTSNGYQIEWYAGDMQGSASRVAFLDNQGNTLRYTQPDGRSRVYAPHYCNRTLGTCRLNLLDQDGEQRSMTVITRATRDGFRQTQRQGGVDRFKTRITLGTYGIRTFERKADGRTITLLRSYVRP